MVSDPAAFLADSAVVDGEVPGHIAEYVNAGCYPATDPSDDTSTPAQAGRWEIADDGAASWAMRRYAEAHAELDAIDDQYHRELGRLNAWRDARTRTPARTAAFMGDHLGVYALAVRAKEGRKTLVLPAGKVKTSQPTVPWKVEVADKDAMIRWALSNGAEAYLRPVPSSLTDLRALVVVTDRDDGLVVVDAESGEVVPGLTAEATKATVTGIEVAK